MNIIPEDAYPGLDPAWRALWNTHGAHLPRSDQVSLQEYRANPSKYSFTHANSLPGTPTLNGTVSNISIPVTSPAGEIPIRIYTPSETAPKGVHLNFHGGGWVVGSLESEAAWCRHMANRTALTIIDVGYRKGPEFPFPAAIHDCFDAVQWARCTYPSESAGLSFGGLSAGGHMSAVLAHLCRDEGIPNIKLQLLIVPATDMRYCHRRNTRLDSTNCPYPSAIALQDAPWSPFAREQWFLKYFLGDTDEAQNAALDTWLMTPMLAPNFQNLAPAHIVTAEFDLERDEGEVYGQKMREAGNKVTMKRYPGVPHAFAHYNHPERGLRASWEFIEDTAGVLREAHFGTGG